MLHYLKAAFNAAPDIPGLGRLPVNLLALGGFTILGFGHPGFWLLGLAGEAAYLYALTTSPRFQRLVDALALEKSRSVSQSEKNVLAGNLTADARERMAKIEKSCRRILELNAQSQAEDFMLENDREALEKLSELYLKLLAAEQNLTAHDQQAIEAQIARQIASVKSDLADQKLSAALRESKKATLEILARRLENFERRELALEEIRSDLQRIEAQIDLALENAGMRGRNESVSIGLVSQLLADNALYGASGDSIAEFERTFGQNQ